MIRKTVHFIFCILFLIVILSGCAKPSQVPEVVATTTVVPQDTEVVATPTIRPTEMIIVPTPTPEPWHLLILSDSSGWGLGKAYASQIEKDVGVKVVLKDYAVGGLTLGEVVHAIKNEQPIRGDLNGLSAAISDAEVIVLHANPLDSHIQENLDDSEVCVLSLTGYIGHPPKNCNPAAFEKYITDLKWVWGEIFRMRNGQPTIIRAMDFPAPWISTWNEKGVFLACTRCFENYSNAIRLASEAYHIPVVHRYDAYNGVNHDQDPVEKGYIGSDGTHPTALAQRVTAELLAQMGYEPVPPP